MSNLSLHRVALATRQDLLLSTFNYLATAVVSAVKRNPMVEGGFSGFRIEVIGRRLQLQVGPAFVSSLLGYLPFRMRHRYLCVKSDLVKIVF